MSTLSMSPASEEKTMAPADPALVIPLRLTNFSIQEILKPTFGVRRASKESDGERVEPRLSAFTANVRRHSAKPDSVVGEHCYKHKTVKADIAESVPKHGSESPDSDCGSGKGLVWPAWVYCTRYSDRPSAGKCLTRSRQLNITNAERLRIRQE